MKRLCTQACSLAVISFPAGAVGIPTTTPPNGNGAGENPHNLVISLVLLGVNLLVMLLIVALLLTVAKNAWQKYHQIGEQGSKVTWRDLVSNIVAGALLVALGISLGVMALNIL